MMETLYTVDKAVGKGVVFGAITKLSGDKYLYIDYDGRVLDSCMSKLIYGTPLLLSSRTYSPRRKDIARLLARHGMQAFDVWELIKRTEGALPTDNLRYVSKDRLEELGLSPKEVRVPLKGDRKFVRKVDCSFLGKSKVNLQSKDVRLSYVF